MGVGNLACSMYSAIMAMIASYVYRLLACWLFTRLGPDHPGCVLALNRTPKSSQAAILPDRFSMYPEYENAPLGRKRKVLVAATPSPRMVANFSEFRSD
jgi:hypothetical protein